MRLFGPSFNNFLIARFRYVLIAVAAVVLGIGYMVLIGPEFRAVRQYGSGDLASETRRLDERKSYSSRLEAMLKKYDALNQSSLGDLEAVLPPKPDIAGLFVSAEALAAKSNLRLISLSVAPVAQAGSANTPAGKQPAAPVLDQNLKSLDVSMTVGGGGSYESFKTFLVNIEDSLRLFNIQSLTFTPPQEETAGKAAEATNTYVVNLRTFYLEVPESAAAAK